MAMELLDHWNDEYEGIIINSESLPSKHLSSNRDSSGEKGCGSKLDTEQAALVSVAINEGFNYHHAEAGYVMLTYWIPDLPSMLPSGPSHHIGVAALPSMTTRRWIQCSCFGNCVQVSIYTFWLTRFFHRLTWLVGLAATPIFTLYIYLH
ncbi:nudix hydrolase 8-like isoform X2 [Cucumis melo]|uniref:Nudix hydrolase 8-like isoform X2 n=1 Tax=Cucumis melo TaxID=3656 RepID=A0A1S3BPG8_CUCME|nr:nudix hydrolase 8-like isoform X2 [Cucumis melo]